MVLSIRWHTSPSPPRGCVLGRTDTRIFLLLDVPLLESDYQHGNQEDLSIPQGRRRYSGWNGSLGECGSNGDGLPFVQSQRSVFHADSDSICRRAHVNLLQVRQMQFPMEREIEQAGVYFESLIDDVVYGDVCSFAQFEN